MRLAGAIVLALAATLAAYLWLNREAPIRYRLTATVESGGKLYTASTVNEVRWSFQEYWSPPAVSSMTGEALIVEVPGKAPIFFLLSADGSADWAEFLPMETFISKLPDPHGSIRERVRELGRLEAGATIPPERYPMIVAFRDLTKPDSVYELSADGLSPPLGPGSRLVSLTIEMTRDRPTTGAVETMLPWLKGFATHLDGDPYQTSGRGFANTISRVDFVRR